MIHSLCEMFGEQNFDTCNVYGEEQSLLGLLLRIYCTFTAPSGLHRSERAGEILYYYQTVANDMKICVIIKQ